MSQQTLVDAERLRSTRFGDAGGEANARAYEVFGYPFLATKPSS